jgi:hypothetical protein
LDFWFENIPSGNPVLDRIAGGVSQHFFQILEIILFDGLNALLSTAEICPRSNDKKHDFP